MLKKLILPKSVDVLIVSPGGVATTMLIEFVQKFAKTNDHTDKDGFKHIPVPPISFNSKLRCIYIYGDPELATVSLFRRNFGRPQSKKLKKDCPFPQTISSNWSLEDYIDIASRDDKFRMSFYEHFSNWFYKYRLYPTLFIRDDSIWEHITEITDFLELPRSAIKSLPKPKARKSREIKIQPQYIAKLENMHRAMYVELSNLSTLEYKDKRSPLYLELPYISYTIILVKELSRQLKAKLKGILLSQSNNY